MKGKQITNLIEITKTINSAIDNLDCGSESLEDLISTSPEMMDELRNSKINGFDEIELGTQKLNELNSQIIKESEDSLIVSQDELQMAHNEINEGVDTMDTLIKALEELNSYIDEDITNIIDTAKFALTKTEVGRMSIQKMLGY